MDALQTYLEACKEEVNAYLSRLFEPTGLHARLKEAMTYSLMAAGKRLRPALVIATAETFGVARRLVLPAAAAVELIHCYSLIHDDLPCMDDDDLRRGQPTNHVVFGEAMALLAGDALLTEAFHLLARPLAGVPAERQLAMIRALASRAGVDGMVGGQAVDIERTGGQGTLQDVEFIHLHKTARLIQACVEIGGYFADLDDEVRDALSRYGECLGLAFQMIDDVLDVTASTEQLGKTAGKDVEEGKLTYPRFVGVERTRQMAREVIRHGEQALADVGVKSEPLASLQSLIVDRDR
ncbi:polyprenyl synthetase family protein [Alicyclobacillus mali (ex Roth et al. 2021)]|uniref:polyprenyl synthetase family protein n=1 Tax=Alicyclobacillus mali (ex Roth et al. 2021) TaxID=1123961 RepID=UPI0023F58037|nr:farnesyl diphosphate synthase [Alicyclobacillus mali (ex Roth et al. 2021)]